MSQKNVAEVIRRKSDGVLFEVLYTTRLKGLTTGYRFMRVGPVGQPRHKRRWEAIDVLMRDYELASSPQEDVAKADQS